MYKTLGTHNYYVYILTNQVKTVLYIGFTNNLAERIHDHQNPEPHSKHFTAKYKCYYLVYWERYGESETGIDRETQLKKWSRKKKDELINKFNPEWQFLNDEVSDLI